MVAKFTEIGVSVDAAKWLAQAAIFDQTRRSASGWPPTGEGMGVGAVTGVTAMDVTVRSGVGLGEGVGAGLDMTGVRTAGLGVAAALSPPPKQATRNAIAVIPRRNKIFGWRVWCLVDCISSTYSTDFYRCNFTVSATRFGRN